MPWWPLAIAPVVILAASWLRWRAKETRALAVAADRALHDGDFDRAATIFEALGNALELARLYALRGDVDRAATWAATARARIRRLRAIDRAIAEARLLFVDALVAARRGDLTTALDTLAQRWSTFEHAPGGWLAEACLLRGFLAGQLGAGIEIWLGLDDSARARVHWMATEWPELRAFIGDDSELS